ncbi:DUF2510 domain-containing protein [Nocardia amamiensis]|uniref:DUF2510 domain-containing protein n=1 Tax=Nocardia amamiensis TaxID=404578 RepID=UPI001471ED74
MVALIATLASKSRPRYHQPGALAPGWYPDNSDPARLRWFDGQRWTDTTRHR